LSEGTRSRAPRNSDVARANREYLTPAPGSTLRRFLEKARRNATNALHF